MNYRDDDDRVEDQRDPFDDRSDEFEGFGEFGVTSAQLPAVDVAYQRRVWAEQQARLVREERMRAACFARIQRGWREGRISNPGYDLLQDEFQCGLIPDLYRDEHGVFYVFSAHENRRYTLGSWERHAQDMLEPGDPERVTERITAPPVSPDAAAPRWRAWAEQSPNVRYQGYQSYAPTATPVYGRPTPPLNPHARPARPPYRNRRETGR